MDDKVKYEERRKDVIIYLSHLSDKDHQQSVWITPGTNYGFHSEIAMVREMVFDEFKLDADEGIAPYDPEHYVLKNDKEAEALLRIAQTLNELRDSVEHNTDEEYLRSPYLPKVIETAKKAYDLFMESEKDNIELTNYIATVKATMKKRAEEERAQYVG